MTETLGKICARTGYTKMTRVDEGSEFVRRDLHLRARANDITPDFSRPGKPARNAFIAAFSRRFRAACLNANWFLTRTDALKKGGGLSQVVQQGSALWLDWPQGTDRTRKSRQPNRPVAPIKPRNSPPGRSKERSRLTSTSAPCGNPQARPWSF
jgi:transposase InsO family protein